MKKIVCTAALLSTLLPFASRAAIIYQEFRGEGEGRTDTEAVENAARDAELKAGASGYADCRLTKYVYYPDSPTGFIASAWMTCAKDTTPPPPPPKYCPKITINPVMRNGLDHTVTWDYEPSTVGFSLLQSINGGEWRLAVKGNTTRSWTMYNAYPADYRYKVATPRINGEGDGSGEACYSAVVGITVSNPPSTPAIYPPSLTVTPSYRVDWNASQNADQYILEKAVNGGWESVYVGTSTYFDVKDSVPGDYSYRVKACQNSACSAASPANIFVVRTIDSIINGYILSN